METMALSDMSDARERPYGLSYRLNDSSNNNSENKKPWDAVF